MSRKYESRAARLCEAVSGIDSALGDIEAVKDAFERGDITEKKAVASVNDILDHIEADEFGTLAEEIGSWRDNMQGTNLENTGKFEIVDNCASELEDLQGQVEDIPEAVETIEDISDLLDLLESISSDAGNIEFPTMF